MLRLSAEAYRKGARYGMPLAQARAIVPEAAVQQHNTEEEQRALTRLAHLLLPFSPLIGIDELPESTDFVSARLYCGINLNVTGCERLLGEEETLLAKLGSFLEQRKFHYRLALSSTLGCAWALSRFGALRSAAELDPHQALGALPVAALRLDSATIEALSEVQLTHLHQLFAIPPDALRERFSPLLMRRLEQAFGLREELILPVQERQRASIQWQFDAPVRSLEIILRTTQQLLERLLAQQTKKVRALSLELTKLDAPASTLSLILNAPSAEARYLWPLLRERLEKESLAAGIETLTVTVLEEEPFQAEELSFTNNAPVRQQTPGMLIDTLATRLSDKQLLRAELRASYIPERTFRYLPHAQLSHEKEEVPAFTNNRPSVLLQKPEQAKAVALLPDRPPYLLHWQGKAHRVAKGVGPERIAPEWWTGNGHSRDYFKVQLQTGTWLWVFREQETAQWYVHGVWS